MKNTSIIDAVKFFGQKPSKKLIEKEYTKLRKNLVRSIKYYQKKGYNIDFITVPEKPKRITEGSLRKLAKVVNEWNYYTGRGPVNPEMLSSRVEKSGEYAYRNLASPVAKSIKAKQSQSKQLQSNIDKEIELKNVDNPFLQQALAQGISISDMPREEDNLAIKIYEIAEAALDPGSARNGNQQALFEVVQRKAQLSIMRFDDMGVLDPEYNIIYSFNLSQQDFYAIAEEFEAWLWSSDQYDNVDLSGLEKVVGYMTKSQKNLSFYMKQKLANAVADEDIDMI